MSTKAKKKEPQVPTQAKHPPTAAELKKHASAPEEKRKYCVLFTPTGDSETTVYRRVPGGVLKPFWNYLSGALNRIWWARAREWEQKYPALKDVERKHLFVPYPVNDFEEEGFLEFMKQYKPSPVRAARWARCSSSTRTSSSGAVSENTDYSRSVAVSFLSVFIRQFFSLVVAEARTRSNLCPCQYMRGLTCLLATLLALSITIPVCGLV